jgi:murein L,D-transpeptidase YafK
MRAFSGAASSRLSSRRNLIMSGHSKTSDHPVLHWTSKAGVAGVAFGLLTALSGCNDAHDTRAMQALSSETLALMAEKGVTPQAPMLIRAYKKESEFEVWKMRQDGSYVLLKTFPICRWSGQLGPKTREGDRQSPEGFYSITPAMMNPNSSYYLSFNIGYPNAYDRAHGATGGSVMVHGVCSSAGCFSMTDAQIAEIYALARESFSGGQHAIQMQAYPFHLNAQNLAKYRLDPNMEFWKELKKGDDHFEATKHDVAVAVCGRHYVFDAQSANGQPLDPEAPCPVLKTDPQIETKAAQRGRADDIAVAELVAKGTRPVRLVYQDGAQHPAFYHRIAEVSRPDALTPPVELPLDDSNPRWNAKVRSASTATALVLAQAQARQDAEEAKAAERQAQIQQRAQAASEPLAAARMQSEKFVAIVGTFGQKDAAPAASQATEIGGNVANDATATVAPPVKSAKPTGHAAAAKAATAKTSATKTLATKTSATKTWAGKPSAKPVSDKRQAALPAKQALASAAHVSPAATDSTAR